MRGSSSTTKTLAFSTGCPLVCLAAGGATERQSRPARVKCIRGAKRARPRNTLILLGVPPYAGQSRVSETRQILHRCVIAGMARQIRGLSGNLTLCQVLVSSRSTLSVSCNACPG